MAALLNSGECFCHVRDPNDRRSGPGKSASDDATSAVSASV